MNVSEERRKLAQNQIYILDKLYKAVSDEEFDIDVDLTEFDSNHLKDFWVYTSGFLCLNKYEKYDFDNSEIDDVFNGEFTLLKPDRNKVDELLKIYDKKLPKNALSSLVCLQTIQDGKFLLKVTSGWGKYGRNELALHTDKPEFDSPYNSYHTEAEKLSLVRNTFAHSTPFISGNKLLFRNFDGNLYVSKMWLRGLVETFANKYNVFDYANAKEVLVDNLSRQGNYILSNQDIDKALSTMKDFFDPIARDNFYRINNLVKPRIQYIPDFFNLSFDKKTDILASVCANNQVYFEAAKGVSNPAIIYNIQKLVAKELERRNDSSILTDAELEDFKTRLTELDDKINQDIVKFKEIEQKIAKNRSSRQIMMILKKQSETLIKQYNADKYQLDQLSTEFLNMIKLESTNMDTMDISQLSGSSLEVAFNIVCLMGFNDLVTSAFYDDLLAKTDFNNLNDYQTNFFKSFDFSKFTLNNKPIANTASTKAFVLLCLREALCHQNVNDGYGVYYLVHGLKTDEKKTFKDIKVTFKAERQEAEISGRLEDFYKLFTSEKFLRSRNEKLITGDIEIIEDDDNYEDDNIVDKPDQRNIKGKCDNDDSDDDDDGSELE